MSRSGLPVKCWLLAERLARAGRELSESMNMRFLYDADRRLFSIGYNVTEGRLDHAYYDLLASEARLGSFVAIARGDIPAEHWFAMSRPYGAVGRRRVLLSWTGTMFEYLMPLLFQRSYRKLAARQGDAGSRGDPDRLRPHAPRAVGDLGVCLRGSGHQ